MQGLPKVDHNNRIDQIASGTKSITKIAMEEGVSKAAISRFAKKHAEEIKKAAEKILEKSQTWVDKDIQLIDHASNIITNNDTKLTDKQSKQIDVAYKLKENYYRSVGIFNSHTPAPVFQQFNIYQQNQTVISPEVLKLLGNKMDDITSDDDVIDAEIE